MWSSMRSSIHWTYCWRGERGGGVSMVRLRVAPEDPAGKLGGADVLFFCPFDEAGGGGGGRLVTGGACEGALDVTALVA